MFFAAAQYEAVDTAAFALDAECVRAVTITAPRVNRMSSRESAKRSSAEPPTAFLSPTEEILVKILNAPFMLVVPVLLSIIAYLSWIAYQNTHPPLFLLQNR